VGALVPSETSRNRTEEHFPFFGWLTNCWFLQTPVFYSLNNQNFVGTVSEVLDTGK
jgi:hypothetical protein